MCARAFYWRCWLESRNSCHRRTLVNRITPGSVVRPPFAPSRRIETSLCCCCEASANIGTLLHTHLDLSAFRELDIGNVLLLSSTHAREAPVPSSYNGEGLKTTTTTLSEKGIIFCQKEAWWLLPPPPPPRPSSCSCSRCCCCKALYRPAAFSLSPMPLCVPTPKP